MKIKKRIMWGILVVVAVIVLAGIGLYIYMDSVATRAVEKAATYATGVETNVTVVHISPFAGELSVEGLEVSNPEGFETEYFLNLDDGNTQVSLGSLMSERVRIPYLHLNDLEMHLERNAEGRANYQIIMENLEKLKVPPDQEAKKYVIDDILITDILVHAHVIGQSVDVRIPELKLTDVGSETEGGAMLSQVQGTIMAAVLEAVARDAGDLLPAAIASGLDEGLASVGDLGGFAVETVGEATSQVTEAVKQLPGGEELGETVGEVGQKATEAIEQGIGGLLGGKKDEDAETEQVEGQ